MAFDPTTLFPGAPGDREGTILKIRPENLWQDTAGTTAVTTDGDPVRRIDDISVNGRGFLILNSSVPFTYHTDGTVHWLTASGAANSGLINDVDWTFMSGNPYSVGAAVSFDTPTAGDQYIFSTEPASGGSLNNSRVHAGVRDGTTLTIAHWFGDANFSHTTAAATAKRHILEYKNPGAEYTIDGTSIGSNGSSPGSLDEVGEARIFHGIGIPTDGDIYGIIIVIDTITAQEKADIDEWLQEQIEGPSAAAEGDLAATLDDTTAAASGDHGVTDDLSVTLVGAVADINASHGVVGDLTAALDSATALASGDHGVAGDLASTLADTTATVAGEHLVSGDLAATLDATTADVQASYGTDVAGDLAATLADTAADVSGAHGVVGTTVVQLDGVTVIAAGDYGVSGDHSATLDDTTADLAAAHGAAGDLTATLADTTADITASHGEDVQGDLAATLDDTTADIEAVHSTTASMVAQLDDTTTAATGDHGVAGSLSSTLEGTTADLAGTTSAASDGTMAATLGGTDASVSGVHGVVVNIGAALGNTTAAFGVKEPSIGVPKNPGVVQVTFSNGVVDVSKVAGVIQLAG